MLISELEDDYQEHLDTKNERVNMSEINAKENNDSQQNITVQENSNR